MKKLKWRLKGIQNYLTFQRKYIVSCLASRISQNTDFEGMCFIAGCGRSGTSMLGSMLSMNPDISYMYEPRAYWAAVNKNTDIWGYYIKPKYDASLLMDIGHESDKVRFSNLFYKYKKASGCNILVEKTPENIFRLPWLALLNRNAKVIFIIRNGNDVARSIVTQTDWEMPYCFQDMDNWYGVKFIKRKLLENSASLLGIEDKIIRSCRSSLEWGALEWICAMRSTRINKKVYSQENQIVVRYEELLAAPWDAYTNIMRFLNLKVDETIRSKIEQYVKPPNNKKSPINLSSPLKELFEDELKTQGYQ